jgi:hypothetical protein
MVAALLGNLLFMPSFILAIPWLQRVFSRQ